MSAHHENTENLKKLFPHRFKAPIVSPSVWVAPGAHVIGDVTVGELSSIWYNTVIRGDVHFIRIGERTNIQDCSLLHVAYEKFPCVVGSHVTVGHSVILHACTVGDFTLVGMGSCVLDGAELGDYVLLGAGSLVTPGTKIPARSKAMGRPAKVVATLTDDEVAFLRWSADHYVRLAATYRPDKSIEP